MHHNGFERASGFDEALYSNRDSQAPPIPQGTALNIQRGITIYLFMDHTAILRIKKMSNRAVKRIYAGITYARIIRLRLARQKENSIPTLRQSEEWNLDHEVVTYTD